MSVKETLRRRRMDFITKKIWNLSCAGWIKQSWERKKNPSVCSRLDLIKWRKLKEIKTHECAAETKGANRTLQHIKGSVSSGGPDLIWFPCNKIRFGIRTELNVPTSKSDPVTQQHVIIQCSKPLLWWATQRKGGMGPALRDQSVCMFVYGDLQHIKREGVVLNEIITRYVYITPAPPHR